MYYVLCMSTMQQASKMKAQLSKMNAKPYQEGLRGGLGGEPGQKVEMSNLYTICDTLSMSGTSEMLTLGGIGHQIPPKISEKTDPKKCLQKDSPKHAN